MFSLRSPLPNRPSSEEAALQDPDRPYDGGNTTGFVSPAQDSIEGPIDLSEVLDLRRPHRYPVRVLGESWPERGIFAGDVLVVDAAAAPRNGRVCVALILGDIVLATLRERRGQWFLLPKREGGAPVLVDEDAGTEVWGIVRSLVRFQV
ncbi:S24 family peptidase [Pararoseomonas sp. SCSIO 73927]|uniref:LexA family protein n=1 Tax=Pararoseomonas sp. SCSIO 73927 TaxID=3114537 RepID=UPI0030D583B1